ncbi:MAG: hypothetical protein ACOX5G_00880 [Kiritimatiellia bacterium]|jgi:hypothetical protein
MKKKKTNTLSFANGMTFDLVSKGKRFLGLGRIRCGDVKLRSGRLPMFVDISTPYGETLLDYELKATDVGARKIVLTFGAKVTEGSFMEWQVHECRRMRTIHDWSKGPQESDVELKLVLKPASRTLNGVKFKGFSYQYTYRSATLPIYMILDRGSWEPGGKAVGNEFWWRSCFSTPVVRFETTSQRYASEWYLPDCANPNVFQFVPMQTEGQGLTFTPGKHGALVTWPTRPAHVRSYFEKPAGGNEVIHLLEHCGDLGNRFKTAPVEVLFAAGGFDATDRKNLYCDWLDFVADSLHKQAGLRRERVQPYGQIEEWGDADLERYRTAGLPKLLEAGAKTVYLANHFQNNMNTYGVGNMCCTVDYKVAETVGEDKLKAFCRDAHKAGARVEMWANTSISTLTTQLMWRNGKPKRIDFLPLEDSVADAVKASPDPFIRTTFGSIEADHYTPQFACLNLRDDTIRAYWMKRWEYASKTIGLDGIFLDSSFNLSSDKFHFCYNMATANHGATADQLALLGKTRGAARPEAAILSMFHAHLDLMREMQEAGYHYCNEDTGVFGIHRHGPSLETRLGNFEMWQDHICNFEPVRMRELGFDPDDIFFQGLAHRMMWTVNWNIDGDYLCFSYHGSDDPADRPTDWHISLFRAYAKVEAKMVNRTVLPFDAGVMYRAEDGTETLWSFGECHVEFARKSKVADVLSGKTFTAECADLEPRRIYVIR